MKTIFRSSWKLLLFILLICSVFVTFCFFYYSTSYVTLSDLPASYTDGYGTGYDIGYSEGYSSGYDAGYKKGYKIGYSDNKDGSISKTLVLPGTILHAPKYACTCPFTVKTSHDKNIYYIYLERTLSLPPFSGDEYSIERNEITVGGYYTSNLSYDLEGDDISFSTLGGHAETINVPPGSYKLWYSFGSTWYGLDGYFGSDTVWYTSDEILNFYETSTDYVGNTVTLYKVSDGNFDTYSVPSADVPFLN